MSCLFLLLIVSFDMQNLLLMRFNLLGLFPLVLYDFGVIAKTSWPNPSLQRFTPIFSSKNFIVLALTFRCLTHLKLTFVYRMR